VRDQHCPSTTIRISGGWVRDKLLNIPSTTTGGVSDIDFVLDNKSGTGFAQWMHDYIMAHREELFVDLPSCDIKMEDYSFGEEEEEDDETSTTTNTNAPQSKHLQTANLCVGNLWDLDFCQLRFEKYSGQSRVPTKVGMASVVEDAFRRDLTINALYFNLNTNRLEDWTEQGLDDLQKRILRTPTAPLPTVLEDPLRLLRAIRFAAQLSSSFHMDLRLKRAAMDKRVRKSLQEKVSKERVGKELDTIFATRDPRRGMQLLLETKLVDILFPLPAAASDPNSSNRPGIGNVYKDGYHLLFQTQSLVSRIFTPTMEWDETTRRYLSYAAFFKPIYDTFQKYITTKKSRDKSILHQLLVVGLRRPISDIQAVEKLIEGAHILERFLRVYDHSLIVQSLFCSSYSFKPQDDDNNNNNECLAFSRDDPHEKKMDAFRWLCYRILKRIGPFWKESLILALASSSYSSAQKYTTSEAVQLYQDLVTGLRDPLGLQEETIFSLKPLLNGSQIQSRALPGASGKSFRKIMQAQEKWQVTYKPHPEQDADQEQELIDFFRKEFPQYR